MLKEMKSLFEYADGNFGTNNTTGLHITMSWKGEPDAPVMDDGKRRGAMSPNKLKMVLLLGDEHLLKSHLEGYATVIQKVNTKPF